MTNYQFHFLSVERATEFIGDPAGVNRLLQTLRETLVKDLPLMEQRLAENNVAGVNDLLHQFKGFAPVFCVDSLVDLVIRVEALSKQASPDELRPVIEPLLTDLRGLLQEVERQVAQDSR